MDHNKDGNDNLESGIDRRSLLKMGVGAAGGALLPGLPAVALAADSKPAIGNYPAGVSGDSVFIGLT
ncbi:MAG TPA: twin-arginine translocation signal domain-containing protein, partial [Burkholderiaceae bacterium]|nr:twin-arginine translocation signal domain-containing protein [Burkholderiaceae bacterium]